MVRQFRSLSFFHMNSSLVCREKTKKNKKCRPRLLPTSTHRSTSFLHNICLERVMKPDQYLPLIDRQYHRSLHSWATRMEVARLLIHSLVRPRFSPARPADWLIKLSLYHPSFSCDADLEPATFQFLSSFNLYRLRERR